MIFPMSSIAQIALLALSASSSATGVGAANDDYEPNGRLGQLRMRNQQHRHQQHLAAHRNNRKLATKSSAATTGTGGSKSSKSGQPGDGSGGGFYEFLDPVPQGCPCFTTADIDSAWDALKAQDPGASCYYTDFYQNGVFNQVWIESTSTAPTFSINFSLESQGFGFPIGFEPDGTPIYPPENTYEYGECTLQKTFLEPIDEAGTYTASIKKEFGAGAFHDCAEEAKNSNAFIECSYSTFEY